MGKSRPCSSWVLSTLKVTVLGLLAVKTISTSSEEPHVITALRGDTVMIHCPYSSNDADSISGSSGAPLLLCSSQDFYPEAIEQVWLCDGQPLNATPTQRDSAVNPDGSFTLNSTLSLPSEHSEGVLYSCWVNHSALSLPITVNYTAPPDGDNGGLVKGITIAMGGAVIFVLLVITIALIIFIQCTDFKKVLHSAPVGAAHTPAHITEVYSTLGNHRPVQCRTIQPNITPLY
ncbi:hypothetical protein MATL_G00040140 [Megalops atlanticus]|uniref:Ig-like domain-containing protein n=1 Tax=Megalops atlanticus TaxID=7932 RepID=A0A9D3QA37_MEGAT|nr:hypothetical protein MATL_G00040140 [Megalops atlanticus]